MLTEEFNGKMVTLYFCEADKCLHLSRDEQVALLSKHQDRRRYADTRKLIVWRNFPPMEVLKMLVYVIQKYEHLGINALWKRAEELFAEVDAIVESDNEFPFEMLCHYILKRFGTPLTPEKLYNRADKTARNKEFNEYLAAVEEAYLKLTTKAA